MRIVFVGAVETSRVALEALVRAGRPPALVITLPREAAHRHSDFSDLRSLARACGSRVFETTNINSPETLEAMRAVDPDLTLVIGWSQVCREPFRAVARGGSVGFHPAALPRLRGRGVIPWTILQDEQTSGSTLFWLDEGVDSGPILLQRLFLVASDETARSLYAKHVQNLADMVPEAVALIEAGSAPRIPQDHGMASICAKRTAEDGLIDWRWPASTVLRFIRAVGDPYPGAFTFHGGTKIHIDGATFLPEAPQYIGIVGQVQAYTEKGFAVLCGDGRCIDIQEWRSPLEKRPPMHCKLADGR
ncbi:methionyl-tRNA formyltransferase [Sinorhizobium sp. BG8]|uniref:methionyl-tRNA formyltransferase n=1 Tax=Sinorhizobium sp. BG8 TaxID=2613773 RepID=UPI00193E83F2|nr:methionyl-tRNA formyltransferase [Sinorhizobium sp. BG8]QRM57002.1 methionyl-tRNA formyltransferase [Sinorhizobium sp. BG8]